MDNKPGKIHFILTGGTIDSHWDGKTDTAIPNEHSVIPGFLEQLKLYQEFEFTEVCMKDSRDLDSKDINKILEAVETSASKKIIITHGTYTLPDTARFLQANLKRKDQTIIFIGSMVPLKGIEASDAPYSLGFAIAKTQDLPAGVFVCMNGMSFKAEEAAKNISEGKFYSVFKG